MKRYLCVVLSLVVIYFAKADFKVVGYLPDYTAMFNNVSSIPFDKLTHLNIAFAAVDVAGNVSFAKSTQLTSIVTEAHNKDVQILMSIGGGATKKQYGPILANTSKRITFLNSLLKLVDDYQLDGLDIDLEGEDITIDYDAFVLELADSIHKRDKIITAALATWSGADIADKTLSTYDFINIMAYDHTGNWAPTKPGPHSSFDQAFDDLNYWIKTRSLPADKAILGVPFYGYEFRLDNTADYLSYSYITNQYAGSEIKDEHTTPEGATIYYNGKNTMDDKAKLALQKGGGIMIWEISQDNNKEDVSLLEVIYKTKLVGIENAKGLVFRSLYPNPASHTVSIANAKGIGNVEFINAVGTTVLFLKDMPLDVNIDISRLENGVYFVRILTTNEQIVSSIAIK